MILGANDAMGHDGYGDTEKDTCRLEKKYCPWNHKITLSTT